MPLMWEMGDGVDWIEMMGDGQYPNHILVIACTIIIAYAMLPIP
jgi:hypothetical protein